MKTDKKQSTLLGLAIGDALGQPFEFSTAQTIIDSGWQGEMKTSQFGFKGMWGLDAGQYTDDTKMALCIAKVLLEDLFCKYSLVNEYLEWLDSKDLRGIGNRTNRALRALKRGVSPKESGKKESERKKTLFTTLGKKEKSESLHGVGDYCGNGTVMRCAPIGVYFHNDYERIAEAAKQDASITHDHPDARDASVFMCKLVSKMIDNEDKKQAVLDLLEEEYESNHVPDCIREALDLLENEKPNFALAITLGTRGTAHETLASAIYCFLAYDSFKDIVAASVLIGGDTDTRAAIAGALAGAYYGLDGIPKEWVEQVEDSKLLQSLDSRLISERYTECVKKMNKLRIKRMILEILEHHDADCVDWYIPEKSEDPEVGAEDLERLIEIARTHINECS